MELIRLLYQAILSWLKSPSAKAIILHQLEKHAEIAGAQSAQITALAAAMQANAAVMQGFLKGFEVTEPPKPRVTRDEDMYKAEMQRRGVPVELLGDKRVQAATLLHITGESELDPAFFRSAPEELGFSFPPPR